MAIKRPENLTPEFIQSCSDAFQAAKDVPADFKTGFLGEILFEVWMAGVVLQRGLEEAGASQETIHDIQFAQGQMSMGRDPWVVSENLLKKYKENLTPTPGIELARDLLEGKEPQLKTVSKEDTP